MENLKKNKIIIVGAGWAGLAAALELSRAGKEVLILEASPQAGGRARCISFGNDIVDNGQHLFIGAYEHTLKLMADLNLDEKTLFRREPFRLYMHHGNRIIDLKFKNLKTPFHLLSGLLFAKGLHLREKLAFMKFGLFLHRNAFEISHDLSVHKLLQKTKQPLSLIKGVWEPLALAALSTPIEHASSKVFLEILRKTFKENKHHSDLLFAKNHLSALLPEPAIQYLSQKGCQIHYNERVQSLCIEDNHCVGVKTNARTFMTHSVILATPPNITAKLLQPIPILATLCQQLESFTFETITTIYFKYAKPLHLPCPMLGFVGKTAQWIFKRDIADQHILSIVITGKGPHHHLSHPELIAIVKEELASIYPELKHPLDWRIISEKRAAFTCNVNIHENRPYAKTSIQNLLLAGDYTQTSYPATLEAAIISGIKAAQLVSLKDTIQKKDLQ